MLNFIILLINFTIFITLQNCFSGVTKKHFSYRTAGNCFFLFFRKINLDLTVATLKKFGMHLMLKYILNIIPDRERLISEIEFP